MQVTIASLISETIGLSRLEINLITSSLDEQIKLEKKYEKSHTKAY